MSLAVDEGEVVGVAAMSFFRTRLDGIETRLAIPVNVATDARYRGQGVFSTLAGTRTRRRRPPRARRSPSRSRTRSRTRSSSAGSAGSTCRGCGCGRGRSGSPGVVRYALGRAGRARRDARRRIPRRAPRTGSRFVPIERFGADMDAARRTRRGRLRQSLLARRGVLQLALPRLAARLPLLRRLPRSGARRRRGRRSHVQARRLRRVPRRPRRRS